jgi:glyoxylate/hydroxypyruvate reductase A
MALIIKSGDAKAFADWKIHFSEFAPGLDVHFWEDPDVDPASIHYAMVWDPEPGRLAKFPNLKLISSSAAGVDNIMRDPHLPKHLPVVRVTTTDTAQRMGDYVCWAALTAMRRIPEILVAQTTCGWDSSMTGESAPETRVGVMGLGAMGSRAAEMLALLGFQTAGWSGSPKSIPGVESYAGPGVFDAFLARTDILVCLLPLTPDTKAIIRAETIAKLPRGACIVNAGRGGHVVNADLIAALDRGHLKSAVLDVFDPEPLPKDSPFWAHPKVIVTPHIASFGSRRVRARHVANVLAAFERGDPLPGLYDPVRGY